MKILKKIYSNNIFKPYLIVAFKNSFYMGGGNLITQIVAFIGTIFFARLFGPKNYGIYATVIAFVMFFHILTLPGLQKVIVREGSKDLEKFSNVLEDFFGLQIFCIVLAVVVCIMAVIWTDYSKTTKIYIVVFSLEIVYFGLDGFFRSIYQATEKMKYLAYFSIVTRGLGTGISIIILYFGAGVFAVLMVNLSSKFIVLIVNYIYSQKIIFFKKRIKLYLKNDFFRAAIVFSLMSFINSIAIKIDILMISLMSSDPKDVGIYNIAHEIAREGLMIRNVIAFAFFPVAVRILSKKHVKSRTLFNYSFIAFLTVLFICFCAFPFVQNIVLYIFGPKYAQSGFIMKYLIFYLPFTFFTLPFTTVIQATHNESLLLGIYTISAILNVFLNILLFHTLGLIGIAYSTIAVFLSQSVLIPLLSVKKMKNQGYLF